jgi:DNA-binding transcriptional MerR regulator
MLKIGEFSKLSQVSIKTLRHYDDIDLLKPLQIDRFTNYRYYSIDQLPHIHRIMVLKELGLSLEQIKLMLRQDLPVGHIRGMLNLKQSEIQQRVREEQQRLRRIEFRLRMIEMEEQLPLLDVVVKELQPLYALTIRRSMRQEDMVALGLEFENVMTEHNFDLAGPVSEIRFEEDFQFGHDDVEFAWPVSSSITDRIPLKTFGTLQPKMIDGLPMVASYIVRGINPDNFADILPIFRRWIVDNEYELCPSHRLVFHRGPTEHAEYEDWIIEFQHEISLKQDDAI